MRVCASRTQKQRKHISVLWGNLYLSYLIWSSLKAGSDTVVWCIINILVSPLGRNVLFLHFIPILCIFQSPVKRDWKTQTHTHTDMLTNIQKWVFNLWVNNHNSYNHWGFELAVLLLSLCADIMIFSRTWARKTKFSAVIFLTDSSIRHTNVQLYLQRTSAL